MDGVAEAANAANELFGTERMLKALIKILQSPQLFACRDFPERQIVFIE